MWPRLTSASWVHATFLFQPLGLAACTMEPALYINAFVFSTGGQSQGLDTELYPQPFSELFIYLFIGGTKDRTQDPYTCWASPFSIDLSSQPRIYLLNSETGSC